MKNGHKTAIVTGGTGALGRVICNTLAENGIKVYVPVRNIEKFKQVFDTSDSAYKEGETFLLRKIYSFHCDTDKEEGVQEFTDAIIKLEGKIDYLVNTAGGYHPKKNVTEMDYRLVTEMMDMNLRTTFFFTKLALKNMTANNSGRIISVAAKAGTEATAGKFAYSISKSAVINLMQTITKEVHDKNITANVIVPNIIDTPANRRSMPEADFTKWTNPEKIAQLIMFLFSDNGDILNGNSFIM